MGYLRENRVIGKSSKNDFFSFFILSGYVEFGGMHILTSVDRTLSQFMSNTPGVSFKN